MSVRLIHGDCRDVLKRLPDASVQCCVTSPPYYGLRDYGTGAWEGGDPECAHVQGTMRRDAARVFPTSGADRRGSFNGGDQQFRDACAKCGAVRADRQIGLEPTPDEYIAQLVVVSREVRRVLRDDGTLWLNIGDSYATRWSSVRSAGRAGFEENGRERHGPTPGSGLKSKDLLGIPWMLAFALRQPYYTGRIRNEADRIWLAAMIDSEGCMFIHKRKGGTPNYASYTKKDGTTTDYSRLQDNYGAGLEIANTSRAIIDRCLAIVGLGSICSQSPEQNDRRKQTIYRWNLRSNECRDVVREIYPFLVAKQQQARILIGCPSTGDAAAAAHAALIALHNGDPTDVDFPIPGSMWEPGWYLRSDIIWAKKNCMPESCTDRPTSSHEHVFLLTKKPRYFYDADAVSEPSLRAGDIPGGGVGEYISHITGGHNKDGLKAACQRPVATMRNLRNVWTIATAPYAGAHFATMPPELAERCIRAGSSERGCCVVCGAPWLRVTGRGAPDLEHQRACGGDEAGEYHGKSTKNHAAHGVQDASAVKARILAGMVCKTTTGWVPTCACHPADPVPCTVLDPFAGAGTTGLVADRLGRHAVLIDLSQPYQGMAADRITADGPLFAAVTTTHGGQSDPVPQFPPCVTVDHDASAKD
jgi:DNA modification methylase